MTPTPPLICPHCGTHISKKNAISCPHCGADEHTAWGYEGLTSGDSLPTGWGEEDDFSYETFLEKEFGVQRPFSWKDTFKKSAVVFVILIVAKHLFF